jgi:hypothetical protein
VLLMKILRAPRKLRCLLGNTWALLLHKWSHEFVQRDKWKLEAHYQ